ncbi:MAG: DNA-binding response regulator [Chloroflexi bacterium]|nr:MAG: DNA-binding response regulator [Chloroflexota bacterium]
MPHRHILIVEDDRKTIELIRLYLEREGFRVSIAQDGRTALELARQRLPDLMILDLMLPRLSGLELCRTLQSDGLQVPIIMLTAKSTEDEILHGLYLGADDYMTKPFSPRELVARVHTVLRRTADNGAGGRQVMRFGELVIDPFRHEVTWCGKPLPLTPKEFKLLETMSREPGRAFTRLELVQQVFGYDYEGLERTVDAHIMNLRKKIEPDPSRLRFIQTIYGVGYRFNGESDRG